MKLESLKEKGKKTKEIMAPKFPNLRKFTNQEAKRISITSNVKKTTPKSYHIKIKWLKICDRKKENLEWGEKTSERDKDKDGSRCLFRHNASKKRVGWSSIYKAQEETVNLEFLK